MPSKAKEPKVKDRVLTESKLIDAAELVISQVGYEGATTRMIAQTAGLNISLINRYFDGKYGLLIALMRKKSHEFRTNSLDYPAQETVSEELLSYAESLLKSYIREINFFKVVMGQFMVDPKFLKKYRDSIIVFEIPEEMEQRLNKLFKGKKTRAEITRMAKDVDVYILGLIIFDFHISGESEKTIAATARNFVTIFARSLT